MLRKICGLSNVINTEIDRALGKARLGEGAIILVQEVFLLGRARLETVQVLTFSRFSSGLFSYYFFFSIFGVAVWLGKVGRGGGC